MIDLSNVKLESDVVPAGEYLVTLTEAQVKETKSGTGEYISAKLRINAGEHEGRFIFTTFNIKNDNAQAVQIGLQQLKGFMKAAGFTDFVVKSVTDLEGATATAVVKNKTDDYGEKAVVSYFKPATKTATATTASTTNPSDIPF
jgi:hypothetical protein